jgi:hypothetical protein
MARTASERISPKDDELFMLKEADLPESLKVVAPLVTNQIRKRHLIGIVGACSAVPAKRPCDAAREARVALAACNVVAANKMFSRERSFHSMIEVRRIGNKELI